MTKTNLAVHEDKNRVPYVKVLWWFLWWLQYDYYELQNTTKFCELYEIDNNNT